MDDLDQSVSKLQWAQKILEQGNLYIHLDPRVQGVIVPAWYLNQAQLVLQVGWDLPLPIYDLKVDKENISGTLSFNRSPFYCVVPWASIFALSSSEGTGMVWPESMPNEILYEIEKVALSSKEEKLEQATEDLQELDANEEEAREEAKVFYLHTPTKAVEKPKSKQTSAQNIEEKAKKKPAKKKLPPYLKVIK